MDLLLDEIAYLLIKVKANLISFGSSRFVKLHTKKIKYSVSIIFVVEKLNYTNTFPWNPYLFLLEKELYKVLVKEIWQN